jgi:hypothetical protein
MKMEQQAELKTKEDSLSKDFKQKVTAWEKAGLFDQIAAKIEEAVEKPCGGDVKGKDANCAAR